MAYRIWVGGLWHETNTFVPGRTELADFAAYGHYAGNALLEAFQGTNTEIGGVITAAERLRAEGVAEVDLVPGVWAGALPSATVSASAYQALRRELLDTLQAALPVDGIVLTLHGAMVAEDELDPEGDLIVAMRTLAGERVPLAVTLDFHANISPRMVEHADLLVPYHTYPHVDFRERGEEALVTVVKALTTGRRPVGVLVQPPLLPPIPAQATADLPMSELSNLAEQVRQQQRDVISCTVSGGYPHADVPFAGLSVLIYTWDDPASARKHAWAIAEAAWVRRSMFLPRLASPQQAVEQAMRHAVGQLTSGARGGPVILVDVGDNIGGGTPGDGTVLLAELIQRRAPKALVPIADGQAVAEAFAAGVGAHVRLQVGGKTDSLHGEPVAVEGRVRHLFDGVFRYKGTYMTGRMVSMGRTAVVQNEETGLTLLLSERKVMPFDLEQLRSAGLDPMDFAIIVVKAAIAWRAAYGPVAAQVIPVDTPGGTTADLRRYTYRHLRRPIYPLDGEAASFERHTTVALRRPPGGAGQR